MLIEQLQREHEPLYKYLTLLKTEHFNPEYHQKLHFFTLSDPK